MTCTKMKVQKQVKRDVINGWNRRAAQCKKESLQSNNQCNLMNFISYNVVQFTQSRAQRLRRYLSCLNLIRALLVILLLGVTNCAYIRILLGSSLACWFRDWLGAQCPSGVGVHGVLAPSQALPSHFFPCTTQQPFAMTDPCTWWAHLAPPWVQTLIPHFLSSLE